MEQKRIVKTYAVTGTFHGSIVVATSEGQARRSFHEAWKGESIIHLKDISKSNLRNL